MQKEFDKVSVNQSNVSTASTSWLQRLKEESWEAELLVSTVSIISVFQLFGLIDWVCEFFIDILVPGQYYIGYFIVFFAVIAINILISMFVIHFFLRAYWVGLVGLNSVFPDYSIDDSVYTKIYTQRMLGILPKLKDSIQKVDELCSVIFSAAFTFLGLYLYMGLLTCLYLLLFNMLSEIVPMWILLTPAIILLLLSITQAVSTVISNLKPNREKKKLQVFNFKVTQLMYILVYGPLYKYIVQVMMIFLSNFKKKKQLSYLILSFVVFGMFGSAVQIFNTNIQYLITHEFYFDESTAHSSYYQSSNQEINFLLNPVIESDQISSSTLKVFVPIFRHEKNLRKSVCDNFIEEDNKTHLEIRNQRRAHTLNCYQKYNSIYINGQLMNVSFLKSEHQVTKQNGIIAYIDISHLENELHKVSIKKIYGEDSQQEWTIPFYYTYKE